MNHVNDEQVAKVWNKNSAGNQVRKNLHLLRPYSDEVANGNTSLQAKLEAANELMCDLGNKCADQCAPLTNGEVNTAFRKFDRLVAEMDEMLEEAQASV